MSSPTARPAPVVRSVTFMTFAAIVVAGAGAVLAGCAAPSASSASATPSTASTTATTTTTTAMTDSAAPSTSTAAPTCATYRTAVDPGMFPMSVAHARACPDGASVEAVGIVLADADGNLWLCDDRHHIAQPACVDDGLLLVGVQAATGGTYSGVKQGDTMTVGASG